MDDRCCSREAARRRQRGSSPNATYAQLTTLVTPLHVPQMPPELAPRQRQLRRLCARARTSATTAAARCCMHTGGLPGYVSKVLLDAATRPGRRGADQPGIGRGLRRDRLSRGRSLPRRAGLRLARARISKSQAAQTAAMAAEQTEGRRNARERDVQAVACRSRATPAPTPTPGTATSPSRTRTGKLVMRFTKTPALVGDLEHWQYDTFIVALARPRAARRCLRDLRAQSRRHDRSGEDARRVAGDRLQLRLPGPAAETGQRK